MSAAAPATDKKAAPGPKVDKTGWSRREAYPGDPLIMAAKLSGFAPGTSVAFKVFPASGDPSKPIGQAKGVSDANGIAAAAWTYEKQGAGLKDPNLVFEADAGGEKALSPALTIVDWVLFDLADENKKPLQQKEVRVVDAQGFLHLGKTSDRGQLRLAKVPTGDLLLAVRGYEVIGEEKPGTKKYASGKQHNLDLREMKFSVEVESPRPGEVYLAGAKIPVKASVKRVGKPFEGKPRVTANNGAKVSGGADAGQSAGGAEGGEIFVVLPAKDGEVEIQAAYDKAITTVRLTVVRPVVASITFEGDDAYKVFDVKKGEAAQGRARFNAEGDALEQLPGAYKMGKKLKAKVIVTTKEALTKPVSVELALLTPPVDEGRPPAPNERRPAPRPLTLRLPADKRAAGVELKGGEKGTELVLESDRALPFVVNSYQWDLTARLNVKIAGAWSMNQENAPIWPKSGDLRGLRVNAVWGPATIAEGKELDPGTVPLKKGEYDPFHIRKACQWAAGGWNLLMNDEGSIVKRLAEGIRLYQWPGDYDWLRGKPKAQHARPLSAFEKAEEAGDPTKAGTDPTAKNWGFGVLDNPTHPGGRPNQWASAMAAALGALGVKTKILYLRPRGDGAINTIEHDPITRGASCHDPKRDWGKPYLAFTGVEVDKSRDADLQGVKLHEDDAFVIEAVSKKRALHKDAATTTHELKPSDPTKLVDVKDRCGKEYAQVSTTYHRATFTYNAAKGELALPEQPYKLAAGEVTIEMSVPAALYGGTEMLPNPYGGSVTLTGPKNVVKQLAAVKFTKDQGQLKGKVELGEVPAGEYKLKLNAYFQRIAHHIRFKNATFTGAGLVTVHAVTPGNPRPETTNDVVQEVGQKTSTITVKSSGKLSVKLIEGVLTNFLRGRKGAVATHGPVESVNVSVDGKTARPVARGELVELGPVTVGEHKLTFTNTQKHANWSARVRVISNQVDEKGLVRANPLTGAQPSWAYKSAKTGKPVEKDAKKDDAGNVLTAPFMESMIYVSPSSGKTVHDGDAEDWHTGGKLTARKPEERFGLPAPVAPPPPGKPAVAPAPVVGKPAIAPAVVKPAVAPAPVVKPAVAPAVVKPAAFKGQAQK